MSFTWFLFLAVVGCEQPPEDRDGDGYPDEEDCGIDDPEIHPDAEEVCDHRDNDCRGGIDEGDLDCDADGVSTENGDCDDYDAAISPEMAEDPIDGHDNDCDGYCEPEECPDDIGEGEECPCSEGEHPLPIDLGCRCEHIDVSASISISIVLLGLAAYRRTRS